MRDQSDEYDLRNDPTWTDLQNAAVLHARERHPQVTHGIALETTLAAVFHALSKDQRIAAIEWLNGVGR
jgi:hypothetical protein